MINNYSVSFSGEDLLLAFNVKDYQNYDSFGISKQQGIKDVKKMSNFYRENDKNTIVLSNKNDKIVVKINSDVFVIEKTLSNSIVGLSFEKEFDCMIYSLRVD